MHMSANEQKPVPLLELDGVSKTFEVKPVFGPSKQVQALRNVSLSLQPGRALALVGESGSGKSTVGRMIVQHYAPTSGEIRFEGVDIAGFTSRAAQMRYRRSVQMVFQDPFSSLNPAHTIRHHLQRALRLHQRENSDQAAVKRILEEVELDPASTPDKYPHELSGGQRQRVNIARALAVNARLIVADEPTSMLDVSIRTSVLGLLRRLKEERGLSLLFITHDIATVEHLAEETAVMFQGQVVERGPSALVVGRPGHAYTQLLRAAVPDPHLPLQNLDSSFSKRAAAVRQAAAAPVRGVEERALGHLIAQH